MEYRLSNTVTTTTDQAIAGSKTFTMPVTVPSPTADTHAVSLGFARALAGTPVGDFPDPFTSIPVKQGGYYYTPIGTGFVFKRTGPDGTASQNDPLDDPSNWMLLAGVQFGKGFTANNSSPNTFDNDSTWLSFNGSGLGVQRRNIVYYQGNSYRYIKSGATTIRGEVNFNDAATWEKVTYSGTGVTVEQDLSSNSTASVPSVAAVGVAVAAKADLVSGTVPQSQLNVNTSSGISFNNGRLQFDRGSGLYYDADAGVISVQETGSLLDGDLTRYQYRYPSGDVVVAYVRGFTQHDIKRAVVEGTFVDGELQGPQPEGSLTNMRFCDATYRYEYTFSMSDTDGTRFVWVRTAKA